MKHDISISEMKQMQNELYQKNKDIWQDRTPNKSKDHFLYMVEEMGECISIIKKKGIEAIMEEASIRERFVEEMVDIEMYYVEILNRLNITPEEYAQAFEKKHHTNMGRDYLKEHKEKQV